MSKSIDPMNRPSTITFSANAEIWAILLEARRERPFDSLSEIVREYIVDAHKAAKAKTEALITEIESNMTNSIESAKIESTMIVYRPDDDHAPKPCTGILVFFDTGKTASVNVSPDGEVLSPIRWVEQERIGGEVPTHMLAQITEAALAAYEAAQ